VAKNVYGSKIDFSYNAKTKTPAVRVGSRMAGVHSTVSRQNQLKRDDCFLRQGLSIFMKRNWFGVENAIIIFSGNEAPFRRI